jgi:hypothetical protein
MPIHAKVFVIRYKKEVAFREQVDKLYAAIDCILKAQPQTFDPFSFDLNAALEALGLLLSTHPPHPPKQAWAHCMNVLLPQLIKAYPCIHGYILSW